MNEQFAANVNASYRMEVVDISDVKITGTLAYETVVEDEYAMSEWTLTDGDSKVRLEEWLEAFDGLNIQVRISLANPGGKGAKLRVHEVEGE